MSSLDSNLAGHDYDGYDEDGNPVIYDRQVNRQDLIWHTRVLAAQQLGFGNLVLAGSPAEYASLSRDQQVALTDRMAMIIAQHPEVFDDQSVQIAQDRVDSIHHGQPLADESYWQSAIESYNSGDLYDSALGGAKDYAKSLAVYAVGGLVIYFLFKDAITSKPRK